MRTVPGMDAVDRLLDVLARSSDRIARRWAKHLRADLFELEVSSRDVREPLEELLRERLLGFESSSGARPPLPNGKCGVSVYVNGLHSIDAFDGIRPRDLLGVEYYEASSAPVQYRRASSTCPVLLLWLKP